MEEVHFCVVVVVVVVVCVCFVRACVHACVIKVNIARPSAHKCQETTDACTAGVSSCRCPLPFPGKSGDSFTARHRALLCHHFRRTENTEDST